MVADGTPAHVPFAEVFHALASVVIGFVSVAASAPATAPAKPEMGDVAGLIDQLANPDSSVRERATQQLGELGVAARPGLVKAIRGNNPEQRSRAAAILLKLPWYQQNDPPEVRRYLSAYGRMDEEGRKLVALDLYRKVRTTDPLLRLLVEEPNDEVRWQIVSILSRHDDESLWRKLRELDVTADDAPVLRIAAQAWIYLDKAKALDLCRRAIEADARNPSSDSVRGRRPDSTERQLDFCSEQLVADAVEHKQYEAAAGWLRRQVPREPTDERFALAKLMVLHAYFGPLHGVEDDVRTWGTNSEAAKKFEQLPDAKTPQGATRPAAPEAIFAAMNLSPEERLVGAYFLMEHKYYEQAEREAKSAAAMPVALDEARLQRDVRVSIILGLLYGAQNKDEPAAEALAQAVTIAPRANLGLWRTEADLWAEVYWRRARAAEKKGDAAAVAKNVESLRQYTPNASDTAIEIVNWLKGSGRVKDGKDLFERVYASSREQIEATGGGDPTMMNDLAWLCARCGERLNDALELANKAVAAKPENAAYLDTAAEANFKLGKREEAIKLETKAMELRPEDEFMRKQVERFKGDKAQ